MPRRKMPSSRSAKRTGAKKKPQTLIVIYCEGQTEERYFKSFAKGYDNGSVQVEAIGQCGAPRTVAEKAKTEQKKLKRRVKKSSFDQDTEVWVATDVDEHPNLHEARQIAKDNNIGYALSNPCFELWVLLHYAQFSAWLHRHHCQKQLTEHMPTYDHGKGAIVDLGALPSGGYTLAVDRALALHQRHLSAGNDPCYNPSTTVWCLTEAIRHGSSLKALEHLESTNEAFIAFWSGPMNDLTALVGPKRRKALLTHFGSLKRLKAASAEDIAEVEGIGPAMAEAIAAHFAKMEP